MKAILINTLEHGGAEKIVLNLNAGLQKMNLNLVVIVMTRMKEQYETNDSNIHYLTDYGDLRRGYSLGKLLLYPRLFFRLRKFIKKNNIELVQSHLFSSSLMNVMARFTGCRHKVQIVTHMLVSYENRIGFGGKMKIASLKFAYKRADLLISISKMMQIDINENILKKKSTKHIVIPNPHDIDNILEKSAEKVDEFQFEPGKKYIVTAGRLVSRKKNDVLIDAFSRFHEAYPDVELIILGDGPERTTLEEQCTLLNISDKVNFLGFNQNPFKFITNSHFFVLASESEGLPNAVIEAMICKVPVISTDCQTGPREIIAPDTDCRIKLTDSIEKTNYGTLVPVGNIELLKEALIDGLKDYTSMQTMSENAFEYVQKYKLDKITAEYYNILTQN